MGSLALYVQKGDSKYRLYFEHHHDAIRQGLAENDANLIFFPHLMQQLGPNYVQLLKQYLHVYYPGFTDLLPFQQSEILYLLDATHSEFEIYEWIEHNLNLNLQPGAYLFFIKPGSLSYASLHEGHSEVSELEKLIPHFKSIIQNHSLESQTNEIKDFVNSIIPKSDEFPALTEGFVAKTEDQDNAIISPEIQRLFKTINDFELTGALKQLLAFSFEQFQKTQSSTDDTNLLLQPLERVYFDNDGLLFVGNRQIDLNPLCRAVYQLFLNHHEGIELRNMNDHFDELYGNYKNLATHTDLETLKQRVRDLCDPRENSINEKLSTINGKFKSILGEKACLPYQILGPRGEAKTINLHSDYR